MKPVINKNADITQPTRESNSIMNTENDTINPKKYQSSKRIGNKKDNKKALVPWFY